MQNHLSSSLLSKNIEIKIYKTISLPVVLYGCETLSFTLRVESRPRVLKSRVLRIIFGFNRDELTEECRKVYNDEFNDLKDLTNITVYQRLLF